MDESSEGGPIMKTKIEALLEEYKERLARHYKEGRHEGSTAKKEMHSVFIACYGMVISELEELVEGE
jgi:hypothetical protein